MDINTNTNTNTNININLNLFKRLPYDMKYTVRQFIDYDTKIDLLFANHPDFMTNNYLYSILTIDQIKNAHRNGLWSKLFAYSETGGVLYDCNGTKRFFLNETAELFPVPSRIQFTNVNGEMSVQECTHPVLCALAKSIEKCPTVQRTTRAACLISGFRALRHLRASDIKKANYLMQGLAYKFMSSLIIYCDVIQKDRIERANQSLVQTTISRTVREKRRIEQRMEQSLQMIRAIEEDTHTTNAIKRLTRMNTRLVKDNVYMKYIEEGMTLNEAKERLLCDRKEQEDKKKMRREYIKAVRQATTQRRRQLVESDKNARLADKKEKSDANAMKKKRANVRKKIVAYIKIVKEAASIAKKRLSQK